jgi:hypothetical protein
MDIHVWRYKTEIYKKSVTNIGNKIYNILLGFIKEIDNYNAFKKELKKIPSSSHFLLRGIICILLAV